MTNTYLFVGSYTHSSPVGIHVFRESHHGGLQLQHRSELVRHASFLTPSADRRTLFAVSELPDEGDLVALRIDPTDGSLTEIDRVPSRGAAPCHISVAPDGRHLYAANYVSGSVAAYAVDHDGRFGELVAEHHHHGSGPHARQGGPHAHSVTVDPLTGRVYAADLGTDRIVVYEHPAPAGDDGWVAVGETAIHPGAGPRHLAFHPELPIAFLVGELDSTLVTLDVDRATGALVARDATSTLPADFGGDSTAADVHVHPGGRYVHVSNRGHDSIATFEIGGRHRPVLPLGHVSTGGRTPRNFAIHPSGRSLLVANQDGNSIVELVVDPVSGRPGTGRTIADVREPVCVTFVDVER